MGYDTANKSVDSSFLEDVGDVGSAAYSSTAPSSTSTAAASDKLLVCGCAVAQELRGGTLWSPIPPSPASTKLLLNDESTCDSAAPITVTPRTR